MLKTFLLLGIIVFALAIVLAVETFPFLSLPLAVIAIGVATGYVIFLAWTHRSSIKPVLVAIRPRFTGLLSGTRRVLSVLWSGVRWAFTKLWSKREPEIKPENGWAEWIGKRIGVSNPDTLFALLIFCSLLTTGGYLVGDVWNLHAGRLFLYASVAYLIFSLKKVPPDMWGVLLLFDNPKREVDSGLVVIPWRIYDLELVTKKIIQIEAGLPTTDEEGKTLLSQVKEEELESKMMLREDLPFRITFADIGSIPMRQWKDDPVLDSLDNLPKNLSKKEKEEIEKKKEGLKLPWLKEKDKKRLVNDPLHQRLTCDPNFIVQIRISEAMTYTRRIRDVRVLSRMIVNTAMATLQESAGRITAGLALEAISILNRRMALRVEQQIGEKGVGSRHEGESWGVDFQLLQIKSMGLPKRVNISIAESNKAGFEKRKTITNSEGEKQRLINLGAGKASAELARLTAIAEGIKLIAAQVENRAGQIALQTQTVAKVVEDANYTVLPSNLELLTGVESVKQVLGAPRAKAPKSPPESSE